MAKTLGELLNPLGNLRSQTPPANTATGGGMMPPTPQGTPLPNTPQDSSIDNDKIKRFIEQGKARGYSDEDIQTAVQKASQDGVFSTKPVQKITPTAPVTQAPTEHSIFEDKHADESVIEQGLKAAPRAIGDVLGGTAQAVGTLGQGATNLLSKGYQGISNLITGENAPAMQFENPYEGIKAEIQGTPHEVQEPTSIGKDISKIGAGASTAAFNVLKAPIAAGLQTAAEAPGTQYGMEAIGKVLDMGADALASASGIDKETAQNIITTGMNTLGLKAKGGDTAAMFEKAKAGVGALKGAAERAAAGDTGVNINLETGKTTTTGPTKVSPSDVQFSKAYESYRKGISPSVGDTNTPQKAQAHQNNVKTMAEDIIANKDSLNYMDKDGNIVDSGRTPKSVGELAQATVQRNDAIYDQYRNLEKAAGLKSEVSYDPVVKNLQILKEKISNNPELQDIIPYIDKKIETYQSLPGDLDSAIEGKKTLNQKLKAFYRNQNYSDVGKDAVDAITNRSLGEVLDKKIGDSQYGELKSKWGAIKQLQGEIFKRDTVAGRAKEFGFFDLANPLSAMEMIDTLVTKNPLGLVKAAGMQGAKLYMKFRNNPNTQIQEFFKKLEGKGKEGTMQKYLGIKNQKVSLPIEEK